MKTRKPGARLPAAVTAFALACSLPAAHSQVPVDEAGNVVGDYAQSSDPAVELGAEGLPLRSPAELDDLVGPVALYPDDLLAIVLPASTYPLQVVEAARFLEKLETDPALEPEEDWDDSIVALVNYPEVVAMLNEDLDWTWQLGEAVVAQQADVIAAIAAFRDKAHAAGNLKSDERQTVVRNDDDIIEIAPVNDDVIYVPYYEPERVIVYQARPAYYYYPDPYPVYYYPYPSWHSFRVGYFWGVTTAFTIGWNAHCLNVYHPTFYGHPYYGHSYWNSWWYRRPPVVVYNNHYYDHRYVHNRYEQGDRWRPRGYTRLHRDDQRITRNRYYPNPATAVAQTAAFRNPANTAVQRNAAATRTTTGAARQQRDANMSVRELSDAIAASRRGPDARQVRDARDTRQSPAERSPAVARPAIPQPRPAIPSERQAIPAQRQAIPAQRQAIPAQRQAIPAQRQATRTWSAAPRVTSTPAPAERRVAPAERAPAAEARPRNQAAAESRPVPRHSAQDNTSIRQAPAHGSSRSASRNGTQRTR